MTVNCPACQAENKLGAKFCKACGDSFAAYTACSACNGLSRSAKFCTSCGNKFGAAQKVGGIPATQLAADEPKLISTPATAPLPFPAKQPLNAPQVGLPLTPIPPTKTTEVDTPPPLSAPPRAVTTPASDMPAKSAVVPQPPVMQGASTGTPVTNLSKAPNTKVLAVAAVGVLALAFGGAGYWYFAHTSFAASERSADTNMTIVSGTPAPAIAPDAPQVPASTPVPTPLPLPSVMPAASSPIKLVAPSEKVIAAPAASNFQEKVPMHSDKPAIEPRHATGPLPVDDRQRALDKTKLQKANKTLDDLLK